MNKTNLFGDLSTAPILSQIPISQVSANPNQPRKYFDPDKLKELADSLRDQGQIQPIVVSKIENDTYIIIAGERRWRALQLIGAETVDCIIREADDTSDDVIAIIENMQRDDLKPIEEAQAVSKLIQDKEISQEDAGKLIGKNRQVINQLLKLNSLPESVQTESLEYNVSKTILVELSQLKDENIILHLWERAKLGKLKVSDIRASKSPTNNPAPKIPNASKLAPTEILIRKGFKLAIDLENTDLSNITSTQLGSLKTLSHRISKSIDQLGDKK